MLLTIQLFPNGRVFFFKLGQLLEGVLPGLYFNRITEDANASAIPKHKICTKEHNADD
jgi:hypothetical protein